MTLKLERTFSCAQQLLLQAVLAGFTRNADLMADVLERAIRAGILKLTEERDGDRVKTRIGIPDGDGDNG